MIKLQRSSRPAFTLIELLVVVAIIALLISILLPSLSRAREQARIAKCLSNLKAMGTAAHTYLNDHSRRDFPWCLHIGYRAGGGPPYSFNWYTEFIYGGGMPDYDWTVENWFYPPPPRDPATEKMDIYVVEPQHRPMNPYFSSSVTWNRRSAKNSEDPTPFVENLPDTFICPSDSTSKVPDAQRPEEESEAEVVIPTWRTFGTSFAINWYWPYYYNDSITGKKAEEGKHNKNYNTRQKWINILGGSRTVQSLGPKLLGRDPTGGWESKFILFYENRANEALAAARPRGLQNNRLFPKQMVGWHKQRNRHSVLMLDGHAAYLTMDTRYVDGPGWTNWPNRPWKDDWEPFNDN